MSVIDINDKKVKIEDGSDSVRYAVEYLSKHPDNARAIFDEAKRNISTGVAHFETPDSSEHMNVSHHLTLIHNSDGTYELRKRTGY